MRFRLLLLSLLWIAAAPLAVRSQSVEIAVTTGRYDVARTGTNSRETILTHASVNRQQFGKLFSLPVEGDIYAQPLIVPDLAVPGQGTHNVVYVATMSNNVYAFDADSEGPPLWTAHLGPSFNANISGDLPGGEDGVLSTPVIDLASGTLYLVSHHNGAPPVHQLHALDLASGSEKFGGPVTIQGSVTGSGAASRSNRVAFDSHQQLQRPALLLTQGRVIVAFGSTANNPPFHGWLFAYDAADLQRAPMIWSSTPDGEGGGIWQSGSGPAADSDGYLYVVTGNGSFSVDSGGDDYGDSFVKLTLEGGLRPVDFFTPSNQQYLFDHDEDLGVSGAVLIPGTPYVVGGGKNCPLYLVDTRDMGRFQAGSDAQVHQSFCGFSSRLHNAPVVWQGPNGTQVYIWSDGDYLKAYRFDGDRLDPVPVSTSGFIANGRPSGVASISANGSDGDSAIVWAIDNRGIFRAVDATDLTRVLWTSAEYPERDGLDVVAKFCPPTVANGKVYVATRANQLNVYGLLARPAAPAVTAVPAEMAAVPAAGSAPRLDGQFAAAPQQPVDLSFEGTIDWIHFGLRQADDVNRRLLPTPILSDVRLIGQGGRQRSAASAVRLTWSGGTPTAGEAGTNSGLSVAALGSGFELTAPADSQPRTLRLYVGAQRAQGELTATLSDGSAPVYDDDSLVNWQASSDGVYTLTYAAASAEQTLTVDWLMANGDGQVRLQAATLAPGRAVP